LGAPREDDDKPMLIVVFFSFVFVHPKKMTMNQRSLSSSCFVYVHPRENDDKSVLVVIFFYLFLCAPKEDNDESRSCLAHHHFHFV
jgi:hypothetical protein